MEKAIKVTITDDTGTVLDTYEVNLKLIEGVALRDGKPAQRRQIANDGAVVAEKVVHEITAALLRRATPGGSR